MNSPFFTYIIPTIFLLSLNISIIYGAMGNYELEAQEGFEDILYYWETFSAHESEINDKVAELTL